MRDRERERKRERERERERKKERKEGGGSHPFLSLKVRAHRSLLSVAPQAEEEETFISLSLCLFFLTLFEPYLSHFFHPSTLPPGDHSVP